MPDKDKPGAGNRKARPDDEAVMAAAERAFLAENGPSGGRPVAVVIPALNEEASIASVVAAVPAVVGGEPTECLVVDDGSTDGTSTAAKRAGALVCRLDKNLGQGRALQVGYRLAAARGAKVVVTLDADGQFDPSEMPRLVLPVLEGRADFVNGSRRLGAAQGAGILRRAGLRFFSVVVSVLTGAQITDPANGFRAFRADLPASVNLGQVQYQTAELLIRALAAGYEVIESPVTVLSRSAGVSKKGGDLSYGYRFARVVLATWLSTRAEARGRPDPAGRRMLHR
ncbi:MAG TPA: glycosyltransferase family 2 protein [Acidimicrobiales bacterium]|nr:glycosyltransferase family 2 protein [Acidimicrobiales bacterium]